VSGARRRRQRPDSQRRTRGPARDIDGVLVVDKPTGMTSAQVVAQVKRVLGARRVGHTGTLDPMATGVLPLCMGAATKLAGYLLAEDKAYEGEAELGVETDSLDSDGEVTRRRESEARAIDEQALVDAMGELVGDLQQVPPMYSAIKRDGRPLYELARAGETVERKPRAVRVDRFDLVQFESPRVRFSVDCSKGTYVRSLIADLGERLGCGAHLTSLRRTRSGRFVLAQAVQLQDIKEDCQPDSLLTPAAAMAHLGAHTVTEDRLPAVAAGQQLPWSDLFPGRPEPEGLFCLLTPSGDLLALASVAEGRFRFDRVFTYGLT